MTFLAIDVGNTRLKWALYDAPRPGAALIAHGAEFLDHIDRLAEGSWASLPHPGRMLGCVVAGDAVKRRVQEQMELWDVTPRWELNVPWPPQKNHYPYTPIVINNTPQKFGELVRRGLRHMASSKLKPPALFVNSWNEWTEGGPLLPQRKYGTGYLQQLNNAMEEGPLPDPSNTKR